MAFLILINSFYFNSFIFTSQMINIVTKEAKDREISEKNVVIFGLEASDKDIQSGQIETNKANVQTLFELINVSVNIEKVFKLRPKTGINAPFVVLLKDKHDRNKLFKSAKLLRTNQETETVFINADETISERLRYKTLRAECKLKND